MSQRISPVVSATLEPFPAFIPAAVRQHTAACHSLIKDILDPSRLMPNGRTPMAVREYNMRQNKDGGKSTGRFSNCLDQHFATIIDLWPEPKELERHHACLMRLATDDRMREAYVLLAREFNSDDDWHSFVWAACASSLDFTKYRESLIKAADTCERIAEMAEVLAGWVEYADNAFCVRFPDFNSASVLLHRAEGTDLTTDLLQMPSATVPDFLTELSSTARRAANGIRQRKRDHSDELGWTFCDFLYSAPSSDIVLAATKARQRNPKTEYLRGFLAAFYAGATARPSAGAMKAIAIASTVAIDLPDLIVTYDDVRALTGPRRAPGLKNSRKKGPATSTKKRVSSAM